MHYVDGAQWSDLTYRVGIAPYEAGYKSLQSWLIGQVMYMRAPNGYMLRPMGLLRFLSNGPMGDRSGLRGSALVTINGSFLGSDT